MDNKQCECNKDKVINDLLKRISNLEFEVEDKQRKIERLNNKINSIFSNFEQFINSYKNRWRNLV